MFNFPKYASIENIAKNSDVLNYPCVVTEKIHGTNARFSYSSEDGLVIGSRNRTIHKGSLTDSKQPGAHYGFEGWVISQQSMLDHISESFVDYIFYGEWCGPGVQKGVTYGKEKALYIFDIKDNQGKFLDWDEVIKVCTKLNLKMVPELKRGNISVEWLKSNLENVSTVGSLHGFNDADNIQEGFVVKPLISMFDSRGNRVICKYKSKKWSETQKIKFKKLDAEKLKIYKQANLFAESVVTDGRVATISDHITREGNAELSIRRTPEFLRELVLDIIEENSQLFEDLDEKDKKLYNKAVSALGVRKFKSYLSI